MRQAILLTSSELPKLHADEENLLNSLKNLGVEAQIKVWDQWKPEPHQVGIVRSIWDYHVRYKEFLNFVGSLEELGVAVHNPASILRWNSHKSYLLGLAELDLPIVPTQIFYAESREAIEILPGVFPSFEKVVVKPAVSASAFCTEVVSREKAQQMIKEILKVSPHGVLVQPFIEEIETEGEWSLIFLNNKFSHAVIKTPKKNDFRVQEEHGATVQSQKAPEEITRCAEKILKRINKKLLYARVDGVVVKGEFLLMELELIEPGLFFLGDETLLNNFAKAIQIMLA